MLLLHLVPDGVGRLYTTDDVIFQPHCVQLLANRLCELVIKNIAFVLCLLDFLLYACILLGIFIFEAEILQFGLYAAKAKTVGDGGIYVECLAGNLVLLVCLQELQGAHVVQTVGNLYENDPDVLAHCEQELLEVLGLLRSVCAEHTARNLCKAIDNAGNFVTKEVAYVLDRVVGVFDNIVQQCCANGC